LIPILFILVVVARHASRPFDLDGLDGLLAAVATLFALADMVRFLARRLYEIVFAVERLDRSLALTVLGHLESHRWFSSGQRYWTDEGVFIRPLNRDGFVAVESLADGSHVYLWRGRPIILRARSRVSGIDGHEVREPYSYEAAYLRGSLDWEKLLLAAMGTADERDESRPKKRYVVHRIFGSAGTHFSPGTDDEPGDADEMDECVPGRRVIGWRKEELGEPEGARQIATLSLSPELEDVVEECRFWHRERDWFKARSIRWRRGYLFAGPPGAGKTSLARGIAEDLDLPVYAPDLATMRNRDFAKLWDDAAEDAPSMVLLEDIDVVFHGRENVASDKGLTLDCVLSTIDGARPSDGVLLVICTNCPEMVDPALGGWWVDEGDVEEEPASPALQAPQPPPVDEDFDETESDRPGRVDRVVLFQPLDGGGKRKVAERILAGDPKTIEAVLTEGAADTPAQFQERAIRRAIAEKFSNRRRP
jgi:hypothetical protein